METVIINEVKARLNSVVSDLRRSKCSLDDFRWNKSNWEIVNHDNSKSLLDFGCRVIEGKLLYIRNISLINYTISFIINLFFSVGIFCALLSSELFATMALFGLIPILMSLFFRRLEDNKAKLAVLGDGVQRMYSVKMEVEQALHNLTKFQRDYHQLFQSLQALKMNQRNKIIDIQFEKAYETFHKDLASLNTFMTYGTVSVAIINIDSGIKNLVEVLRLI